MTKKTRSHVDSVMRAQRPVPASPFYSIAALRNMKGNEALISAFDAFDARDPPIEVQNIRT